MDDKEQIKTSLSKFIKDSMQSSQRFDLRDGSEIRLNKAIYEIQNHLASELIKNNINTRLNDTINSKSIIKSFDNIGDKHHRAENYAFPFLKYLYEHFIVERELLEYIDGFVEENKESLSWQDIVLTKTGVTRCKTNIRFSLYLLRDLGLVRSRNEKDKRTLLPTVIGQLLVLYFDWIKKKHTNVLSPELTISFDGYLHFCSHLERLKDPIVLTEFLDSLRPNDSLKPEVLTKVDSYLKKFIEIILKALSFSNKGVKYNTELKKSEEYKTLLTELNEDFIFLRNK